MDIDQLMLRLQSYFSDSLSMIIGCGLSIAEGLPSMGDLSNHLLSTIPARLTSNNDRWDQLQAELVNNVDLETALQNIEIDDDLTSLIRSETSLLIRDKERQVISELLQNSRVLKFTELISNILISESGISIITTNYDRLLEISCELAGVTVDTLFTGHSMGKLNPKESQFVHCRGLKLVSRKPALKFAKRVKILKPHGSLDWYSIDNYPVRCPYELPVIPLIIAPGSTKYKEGYEEPFDAHREHSNHFIDSASKYVIIGYGFNDDHLQIHLNRNLRSGKDCLILTHSLTQNGEDLFSSLRNAISITADPTDNSKSIVRQPTGDEIVIDKAIWDIGNFVKEVLQ